MTELPTVKQGFADQLSGTAARESWPSGSTFTTMGACR